MRVILLSGPTGVTETTEGNVTVYPTNSRHKLLRYLDAVRVGRRLPRVGVVSAQDPFETALPAWLIARHHRAPLHLQVHTDFLAPAYRKHSLVNRIRVLIAGFILHRAARIRVVSNDLKARIMKTYGEDLQVTVLPIFVDLERLRHPPEDMALSIRFAQARHRILVVSRLEPEKNVALAIHAFTQVAPADACLIIVGDGSLRGTLTELARMLNVADRVFFEGYRDPAPYYAIADLVLVPSLYEGYGLVIIEALAAGVPVLSTPVGIAKETGAIVAAPQDFAQALARWFTVKEDHSRPAHLERYQYQNFEEYAKAYADDIKACIRTEK